MLLYVILALTAVSTAVTLVTVVRLIRRLAIHLARKYPQTNRSVPILLLRGVAGSAVGIRDVDAFANLDPNTLKPRYRQANSLQKPWGW